MANFPGEFQTLVAAGTKIPASMFTGKLRCLHDHLVTVVGTHVVGSTIPLGVLPKGAVPRFCQFLSPNANTATLHFGTVADPDAFAISLATGAANTLTSGAARPGCHAVNAADVEVFVTVQTAALATGDCYFTLWYSLE